MAEPRPDAPDWTRYAKHAFLVPWNLLFFGAAAGFALLSPWPDAALPIVAAGELGYIAFMLSLPRFRTAVDARAHAARRAGQRDRGDVVLHDMLASLPLEARARFGRLRQRCIEMRAIASHVRGDTSRLAGDELATPGLDRLLWMFLRLLVSQSALARFLESTDEAEIRRAIDAARTRLDEAATAGDERMRRSLAESLATAEFRLENYRKAEANRAFIEVELERVESSIQALAEMAVNRTEADLLASQVDAAVESMHRTEDTLSELTALAGLGQPAAEPPPILESRIDEAYDVA